MDSRQEVKSLKKALGVLNIIKHKGEATVFDIALGIGIPHATAYRLLETFVAEGYVERQPHSPYYRLTSKVLQLGSDTQDSRCPGELLSGLPN
jgi:IclR family mhp operon transcriptional activator